MTSFNSSLNDLFSPVILVISYHINSFLYFMFPITSYFLSTLFPSYLQQKIPETEEESTGSLITGCGPNGQLEVVAGVNKDEGVSQADTEGRRLNKHEVNNN